MKVRADPTIPLADPFLRATLLGLAAVAIMAARWFPFSALPPLCSFKAITGLPCLSCGMTRSWVHLVHGRIEESWLMSPLGLVLCIATLVAATYGVLRSLGAMPALRVDLSRGGTIAFRTTIVLIVLLNWGYVVSAGRA